MTKNEILRSQGFETDDVADCSYEFIDTCLYLKIKIKPKSDSCPHCGTVGYHIKDYKQREYKGRDFGIFDVYISERYPRLKCIGCKRTYTPEIKKRATHKISNALKLKLIEELKEVRSIASISRSYNVPESLLINILENDVEDPFVDMDISFCIDEFQFKKGSMKDFCCIIIDLLSHKAIKVLEDNKKISIERYFSSICIEKRLKVRYIATDMNAGHVALCREYFPRAIIAYDPFHYIKEFTQAVCDVARRVSTLPNANDNLKRIASNTRLLIKKLEDLKIQELLRNHTDILESRIRNTILSNHDLHMAYEYYQIFMFDISRNIKISSLRQELLKDFVEMKSTGVPELILVANHYEKYFQLILNSFKTVKGARITNGPIEGTNRIAKDLRRFSAGYINKKHFIKRLGLIINRKK